MQTKMQAQKVEIRLCTYNQVTGADGDTLSGANSLNDRNKHRKHARPPKANRNKLSFVKDIDPEESNTPTEGDDHFES